MTLVFVHALDSKRKPRVADTYELEHLPRKGDEVIVDEGKTQFVLEVKAVRHFARSKGALGGSQEAAHLECKLIETIEL